MCKCAINLLVGEQSGEGVRMEVVMVLVTGSAAPCLPPELCVHVTRVSFALPPLVLEERLLKYAVLSLYNL